MLAVLHRSSTALMLRSVLFRRCLHDDLLLPTFEFDTDCSTHHSRQHQLCMQVLTTGCKKSIPSISRRSNGSTLDPCRGVVAEVEEAAAKVLPCKN